MSKGVPKEYRTGSFGGKGPAERVAVRPCSQEDLKTVADLVTSVELCCDGLEDQFGEAYVVAEASGKVIACAGIETHGPHGLLRSVAVVPGERGSRIGESLVANRLEWARSKNIAAVYLLTLTAAGYFERFGFRRIERSQTPPEIRNSREFSEACPETADVMMLSLDKG